jgi:hypothetical protein
MIMLCFIAVHDLYCSGKNEPMFFSKGIGKGGICAARETWTKLFIFEIEKQATQILCSKLL